MQKVVAQAGLVVILAALEGDNARALGSGFVCSKEGHVLTCAHLLNLTANICLSLLSPIDSFEPMTLSRGEFSPLEVLHVDSRNDLALLKLKNPAAIQISPGLFGVGASTPVGTAVGCLGVPYADKGHHTLKLTSTIICGKSLSPAGTKQLHLDANMHSGNSGGPVIDVRSGQMIGVVSGRFSPVGSNSGIMIGDVPLGSDSTISFATPIESAFPLFAMEGING